MRQLTFLLALCFGVSCCMGAYPTAGLQMHLDASQLSGYNDGDVVLEWIDLAGGDNTATSIGTPTYKADGINGLPVVVIEGTSDMDGYGIDPSQDYYRFPEVSGVKTVVMAFKRTSNVYYTWSTFLDSNEGKAFHGDTNWGRAYWDYNYSIDSVKAGRVYINGGGAQDGGWTGIPEEFHVVIIQIGDGSPVNLAMLAHTDAYGPENVFGMELAEVLLYDQALSETDQTILWRELGYKYGVWVADAVSPANEATLVSVDADLEWATLDSTMSVDVYFDANDVLVNDKDESVKVVSDEAVSRLALDTLDYGVTYYWRVDVRESDGEGGVILREGPVWSFTTVPPEPVILAGPVGVTVAEGETASFSVTQENGTSFQWYRDGEVLSSETGASLSVANVTKADEGLYSCKVMNGTLPEGVMSDVAGLWTKRLIAHWSFDDTLVDTVDGWEGIYIDPNEANPAPAVVYDEDSVSGKSMRFVGDDQLYVAVAGSEDFFNYYPNGFTACGWMKTAGEGTMIGKEINSWTNGWAITAYQKTGTNVVRQYGDMHGVKQISDDEWHFIVTTLEVGYNEANPDAKLMRLYIDGVLDREAVYTGVVPTTTAAVTMGAQTETYDRPLEGLIDEISLYSYSLGASDVAQMYADVTGTAVCMGAVEYDFNGDCKVDLEDLAYFAGGWLDSNIVEPSNK